MASAWRHLIEVELSEAIVKRFTSPQRLFGPTPEDCDLLFKDVNQLREYLDANNLFLPRIFFKDSSKLKPDQFRIRCSSWIRTYSLSECTIPNALYNIASTYHLKEMPTPSVVHDFVCEGDRLLESNSFGKAMAAYDQAYYWAMIVNDDVLDDVLFDFINTVTNIGYIFVVNNKISPAVRNGRILADLVEDDNFHDPVIKFQSHIFFANALWMAEERERALQVYALAADDVANYPETGYRVFALWQIVSACFALGVETENTCRHCLIELQDILSQEENASQEIKDQVAALYRNVAERKIEMLERQRFQLFERCEALQKRLSLRNTIGNITRYAGNLLLHFSAILPRNINYYRDVGNTTITDVTNSSIHIEAAFRAKG